MMKRVLVIGSKGRLGATLVAAWAGKYSVASISRGDFDLLRFDVLEKLLLETDAEWVVNASGLTSLEACEEDPQLAYLTNKEAVGIMASACKKTGKRLIHFSTDYVFDGEKGAAYGEEDPAFPLGTYGKSKLEGERLVLASEGKHFVFRVSWVFGIGRPAFPDAVIRNALESENVRAVTDKWSSPTSAEDIAGWVSAVIEKNGTGGLYHLSNSGACSWLEYAECTLESAKRAGIPVKTTAPQGISLSELGTLSAPRPKNSVLATDKFFSGFPVRNRSWQDALDEYVVKHVKRAVSKITAR